MEKAFSKLGKVSNGVKKCEGNGYSELACVVSQVAKETVSMLSIAGAGILISVPNTNKYCYRGCISI